MSKPDTASPTLERAYLVGLETRRNSRSADWPPEESLAELAQLARTAGLRVIGRCAQKLNDPNPATWVGPGKAEEIRERIDELGIQTVIFDGELAPGQQRNLERLFGERVKVLDRSALILDIFAQHAHTREGQLQVELAQYEYRLPRLTRLWTHLIRQAGGRSGGAVGGVGLRGPGETQLESDRRQIRRRITALKEELEKVRRQRDATYRYRRRRGVKTAVLVGYTNAGKSSLLNALSRAAGAGEARGVLAADQLFATLDPTTRRIRLPRGTRILVTDTVGFINKLPVDLIAAFRATLEGIARADLLLHVVDITSACAEAHIRTVEQVLISLGAGNLPRILVWNKIDRLPVTRDEDAGDGKRIAVSAKSGENIPALLNAMEAALRRGLVPIDLLLPYGDDGLKNLIFSQGMVESFRYLPEGTRIRAYVPPALAGLAEKIGEAAL